MEALLDFREHMNLVKSPQKPLYIKVIHILVSIFKHAWENYIRFMICNLRIQRIMEKATIIGSFKKVGHITK